MIRLIDKFKKMPVQAKASIGFFLANIVTTGIAYFCTPIYTRFLSTTEYGRVTVYLTWKQVFGILAMFCLSYGVFNNGMSDHPDKRDEYSFSILILSNIITVIFSVVIIIAFPFIFPLIDLDIGTIALLCVIYFFQPAYSFWTVHERYEYKYKKTVIWTVLSAIVSPIIAIFSMIIFSKNKYYGRIFGAEIPLIIIYIGFYFYIGKKSKWKLNTGYWKEAFLFNLPLIPHYLSTYLLSSSDKIMISNLVNESSTAYYSVAYSVASVALIVWSAINASLLPFTYENCSQKKYKEISDVTLPILLFFAGVCVMVILLAPEVVSIMATADYKQAIYVIPPVVGGVYFQIHYYIYANIIYYYKKPKYVMIASISATILNIVLNYFFIQKYGFIAAGFTTLFCYLLQAVMDYFSMKKIVGNSVYDMKKLIPISVVVVLFSSFGGLLYKNNIIRLAAIVLMLFLAIWKRKVIVKILLSKFRNALG